MKNTYVGPYTWIVTSIQIIVGIVLKKIINLPQTIASFL